MITNAPITPGIQPHNVRINIMTIEPQPLSITAKGGNKIDRITRKILIIKYSLSISLKNAKIVTAK